MSSDLTFQNHIYPALEKKIKLQNFYKLLKEKKKTQKPIFEWLFHAHPLEILKSLLQQQFFCYCSLEMYLR